MVDIGTVVAGGTGVAVVFLAVLTFIQVVGAWPTREVTWKVFAVALSAVAMVGVGVVVTYRAATGKPLTVGLLVVAGIATVVTAVLAEDVSGSTSAD